MAEHRSHILEHVSKLTSDEISSSIFLFEMCKEVKHFYETPVIFFTLKDYADIIFNFMCQVRRLLWEEGSKAELIETIVEFHLQWLHAVKEIENYSEKIDKLTYEDISRSFNFTIDAISSRSKYFRKYVEKYMKKMSNQQQINMNAEFEIVEEMNRDVTKLLQDKLKCLKNFSSEMEFKIKMRTEIESLLNWLDKIFDGLAILLSRIININVPELSSNLTRSLKQIVDQLECSKSPNAKKLLEEFKQKGKELNTLIRCTKGHDLEISKVMEKINILEERISRLASEHSSAVMALENKKTYLLQRLASLENLKLTVEQFHESAKVPLEDVKGDDLCGCLDYYELRIFNHMLPQEERQRLVTDLCVHWNLAIYGDQSQKSMISILSAVDAKEEFIDELGTYHVDQHSRKIYRSNDPEDETLYQPNENNELVPLSDDSDHIYFYDECGRYYINANTRLRVYKAHASASEYMMDTTGVLLKVKEVRDGVTYYYDNFGRYYINETGKYIYRDEDALSEYENDGLGNLVRMRSHLDMIECAEDAQVTEDFKYLKENVGPALRHCIADVVLRQPVDPIKYLAAGLEKYRENIEWRDSMARDKQQLDIEREIKLSEEREAAERAAREAAMQDVGSEASVDTNLMRYGTNNEVRSGMTVDK